MLNGRFQSPYEFIVEACPFRVPAAVKRAVLFFLCKHVNGRAISTTQLVKEVRSIVPDCNLTDDQIEEYAVRTAIREEFAIKFDRKKDASEPWDAFMMPK
ncbi:hypothetical protein [Pseudaminobacter sp. NGMCC 1.201702]|uniref:hypothetical protein n=1 Tax=Pseudaminobacter sp. NGMCC 1.201702 TaxID=3391825 RepID=UPI0039EFB34B